MDTTFHDLHPPRITSVDDDLPEKSDYHIVGTFTITNTATSTDMNRVIDPQYPWRDYTGNGSPAYAKKVLQILAQRDKEVDHYVVTRRRFWQQGQLWELGDDEQVTITKHTGYIEHHSHIVNQSQTTTDRITADLGINLSVGGAAAPGELPPVPPMAMAADDEGGSSGSGGSSGQTGVTAGLHFSHEMTDSLHITDTDEQTYTQDTTVSTVQNFKGRTIYVYWQLREECVLERALKATPDKPDVVYTTLAATQRDYTDAFTVPPPAHTGGSFN